MQTFLGSGVTDAVCSCAMQAEAQEVLSDDEEGEDTATWLADPPPGIGKFVEFGCCGFP